MVTLLAQQFDWFRVGPLSANFKWTSICKRMSYIDITKQNYFGKWYVDITGDQLEVVRTVETVTNVFNYFMLIHWTRLDVAFDVTDVDIAELQHPGSAIVNDGVTQTIYSHNLKNRGNHPLFARVYDAFEAGHDVAPGTLRAEVEFKMHYPDLIRDSPNGVNVAFAVAARYLCAKMGLCLPSIERGEWQPTKRLINHERERFYHRFGKRILNDAQSMGYQYFCDWVHDCTLREKRIEEYDNDVDHD